MKAKKILSELYEFFMENEEMLHREMSIMEMGALSKNGQPREKTICDFIASMTDRYALNLYSKIFFPSPQV